MSLAPLFSASLAIQFHAFAAMAAFALGVVQLGAPKGTLPHRTIGWIWVTLTALPLAVWHAHSHAVRKHRNAMVFLFIGGLGIAGVFTVLPGRIMHAVVFGP
jgi:uncharacterized membrane protein